MQDLVNEIIGMKNRGAFTKYIDYIRFPRYRNLEPDSRIDFSFPLTALVGQNGFGKSSTLQALWGTPEGKSVGNYWFSTEVDPIKNLENGKRNCMIYAYKKPSGEQVEVLKIRIKKRKDPDYWETSRPLKSFGMETMGGSRSLPIDMKVDYIDFRSILSAFDKYFYFNKPAAHLRSKTKQEYLRKKSKNLRNVLENNLIQKSANTAQNNLPEQLSVEELEQISEILGKNYVSGIVIEHKFFKEWGTSVIYKTDSLNYSEAFAGSGEIAVVELVHRIHKADNNTLILLDEPDVSLHPGAQERLKIFLLKKIKGKKIQVVISTHSPSLISGLPPSAIKVFSNGVNGRVRVIADRKPEEAFFVVGHPNESLKTIIVEDGLAQNLIEAVLKDMPEEVASQFEVQYYPGGAENICQDVTLYSRRLPSKFFVLFDGDKKPVNDLIDVDTLTERDKKASVLADKIRNQVGCQIPFHVDGGASGSDERQKVTLMLDYLRFWNGNVYFLPEETPEKILWDEEHARSQFKLHGLDDADIGGYMNELQPISDKDKFVLFAKYFYGDSDPKHIKQAHDLFLAYWRKQKGSSHYIKITEILETMRGIN
ncbi:ATP-binding protein [Patescibacteria group bacterium]|nr:ATP-binding protein [Patescibacteria group bacterium]